MSFQQLNELLKSICSNNEIVVLDFSHFSPVNTDKYDIYFEFIASKKAYEKQYSEYLTKLINDTNSVWRKYEKGNQRLLYNFNNKNKESGEKENVCFPKPLPEKENIPINSDFDAVPHLIEGFEASKLPGKCFIIYAENHGNAQSIVYVLLKEKIGNEEMKDLKEELPTSFELFNNKLHDLLVHEMVESLVEEKKYLYDQTKLTAVRAAISQVNARNGSHNMGAHVLNKLTDASYLQNFCSYKNCLQSYKPSYDLDKEEHRSYTQLALFNNYIKCRMDFLAEISAAPPVMQTNKYAYKNLFKELDKVRLLLENISGLPKFQYSICFKKDGKLLDENNDFHVAMPNDILGMQAFYNILENIIRNTAKHNQEKSEQTIFTVNFKDITEETQEDKGLYYEVEIYDNVRVNGNKEFGEKEQEAKSNCHKSTNTEDSCPVKKINWLVFSQNEKLNGSVLDENNQLRNSSLGLLEMEASASFLRKLDVVNIESNQYDIEHDDKRYNSKGNLNILKAFKTDDDCLGYRFFISKPTEFLFIGNFDEITPERKEALLKMGIWFRAEDIFKKEIENGIVFSHQFVFRQSVQFMNDLENERKTQLPIRIVELNEKTDCLLTLLKTENIAFEEIEECVWQIWFDKIKGDYQVINVITSYQKNTPRHTITGRYNIVLQNHNNENNWKTNKCNIENKDINFLEPLSSNAQKALPSFKDTLANYCYYRDWKEVNGYKLFDAAISNILVIDERIQHFSKTNYEAGGTEMPIKEIFEYTNVIVPDATKYPLDADNFDSTLTEKICQYIDEGVSLSNFVLIHFSILERMYKDDMDEIDVRLKEWAKKTRVVVTSGRGKPREHLPKEVCYVNLSPVLNVFTQTRNKYSMNYLLHQARQ